jgi:hypothetical protein
MTADDVMPLVKTTVLNPPDAARMIMGLNLSREVLWTALALVAALNTLIIQALLIGSGPSATIPSYFHAPFTLFVLMAGVMVIYVHALFWAGLALKGQGRLDDLLAVIVWLQVLRIAAQLGVVLISLVVPALGVLAMIAVAIWGLWILLNFIATALNLPSPGHGLVALIIGLAGLVLSLSILLALIGVGAQGSAPHV